MAEPTQFKVWSEHHDEAADAGKVDALTSRGALLMALAEEADDDNLPPDLADEQAGQHH